MNLRTACLIVLMSAGMLAAQDKPAKKPSYTSTDAKCEITFPAMYKAPKGDKNSTQVILEVPGKGVYMLFFNALPNDATGDPKTIKKAFDNGRDALVKTFKGKVIAGSEKDKPVGKYPGRDLDVEAAAVGGVYRARFVLTPKYFFQVVIAGPKEFVESAEATAFRDSFKMKD